MVVNRLNGLPSAADIVLYTDALAGLLKNQYGSLGRNAPGETGTGAAFANLARVKILGDSTAGFPGLGSPNWQAQVASALDALVVTFRYDTLFRGAMRTLMSVLDNQVLTNLPAGWTFLAPVGVHVFDPHLTRLNGAFGAPATPLSGMIPTLTGINNPQGALPACAPAMAPRVVFTLVGQYDYNESLPSPEAAQVGLSSSQNAYQLVIGGTVPSGVRKVRVYRSFYGGSSGAYFWDQDVTVGAGAAFPPILLLQPDARLRVDVQPPTWMSAAMTSEAAALFALAFAGSSSSAGVNGISGQGDGPLLFAANGMLSPTNVVLEPSNGFVGVGNVPGSAQFAQATITAQNTVNSSPGSIQTANCAANNVQGYAGALGLQMRVTQALGASAQVAISYTYFDALHGWGSVQTAAGVSAAFPTGAVGETVAVNVPAGQVVQTAQVMGISGSATAGSFVLEAAPPRAY